MIFYWISLIVLIVLIGLVIWLLVRTFTNTCSKKKFGESCNNTVDCTGGLICSSGTCKVSFGQTCSSTSECVDGLTCDNGICTTILGKVKEQCPCDVGHTCVNNICKVIVGGACTVDDDCVTSICVNGVCLAEDSSLIPDTDDDSICYSEDYTSCEKTSGVYSCSDPYCSKTRYNGSSGSFYSCSDPNCSKTKYIEEHSDEYSEYSYMSNYTGRDYTSISRCDSSKSSAYTIDMSESD